MISNKKLKKTNLSSVNCLILAGGESSRMQGQDKAQLLYKNRPMIESVIRALPEDRGKLIISCNQSNQFYQQFTNNLVSDDSLEQTLQNCGPLSGVLSALELTSDLPLLVLPCDTPELSEQLIQRLVDCHLNQSASKLTAALVNDKLQPLHCIIEPELINSLRNYLQQGKRKVANWVFQHDPNFLDCSDYAAQFININSYKDLTAKQN